MKNILAALLTLVVSGASAWAQSSYTSPETGTKVLGTYFATDIDNVSLTNGNLHVSIPVFSLPGRELPLSLSMEYNSQFYEGRSVWDGEQYVMFYEPDMWQKNAGVGASVVARITGNSAPGCYTQDNPCWRTNVDLKFTWISPDGSKHDFKKTVQGHCNNSSCTGGFTEGMAIYDNAEITSTESDFITLRTGTHYSGGSQPATITFKNGTVWDYTNRTLTTRNGNRLTVTTNNETLAPADFGSGQTGLADYLPLSDTLGRTITYSNGTDTKTITLKDANGSDQVYSITWGNVSAYRAVEMNQQFRVVRTITLPNSKTYQLDYNSEGYLSKITLPSGAYIRYTYTSPTGKRPHVATRVVSSDGTSGTEKTWTYTYSYSGSVISSTTVQDPTGAVVWNGFANELSGNVEYRNSAGTVLKATSRGWSSGTDAHVNYQSTRQGLQYRRTEYEYDSHNNVTREYQYDWDYSRNRSFQEGPLLRTFVREYNSLDLITVEKIHTPGANTPFGGERSWTNFSYDEYSLTTRSGTVPGHNGNTSQSGRGNLTTIARHKDSSACGSQSDTHCAVEHIYYDNVGNAVQKLDPLGNSTSIDYTDDFCPLTGTCTSSTALTGTNTFAFASKVTNALSQFTRTKYDFNTGLPKITTDLRGYTTTMTYDALNRTTSITEPNNKQTTYSFDDTNRITTKEVTVDSSNNKGHVETYFDKLYRATQTRTNDPDGAIAVDNVYDALNRVIKSSNPYRLSGSASAWTYSSFDAIGRVVCTSVSTATTSPCDSGGSADAKVTYEYVENTTTTTNEAGNKRRYSYDGLGRMTKVEEPNPTLDSPLVTTYTYELIGPLKQTSQSGQTRTLTHDWLGRETQEQLPESGTTTYTYDDAGRMLTATDARSVVTTYQYDYLGRATQRSYSDSTPTVKFTYDQNGYTGLRTKMEDALGVVTYAYDNMGRLTSEGRTIVTSGVTDGTFTTSYAYNIKGDLTQMTYPSGRGVNFNYATNGGCCNSRLSSVSDSTTTTTLANSITFDPSGAVTARTLNPNGTVPLAETFAYNHRMQQTQVRVAEGSTYVMDFSYGYGTTNNVGQLLSRTDAVQPEHSVNYAYDSIYRLSQASAQNSSWGIAWTFDVWSNRLTQTPQGYVYAANIIGTQTLGYATTSGVTNNRLSETNLTYDAAGNLTHEGTGGHSYTFNGKNQITQVDGGNTATYLYDGEGRRVKKTTSGVSTFYFYGPGSIISEFSTSSGASAASSSDVTSYETADRQGTAVLLIAANGVVLENNRTLPYGELWCPPATASATTKKFTTYERDSESNLDYAGARYSAPTYGRFTSVDAGPLSLSLPRSLNRYLYTIDDPVNLHDSSGNSFSCDAQYSFDDCGGAAGFWGGRFGNEYAASQGLGLLPGRFQTEVLASLQQYIQDVNLNFAGATEAGRAARAPCEQDSVRNTIEGYAGQSGVQFAGYNLNHVSVAGFTSTDGTLDSMTELFLDASSPEAWTNLEQTLKANGFAYAGYDPLHGDYTQSYRQMTGNGQWSMQVSYNAAGHIQVDIDPHNPMQGFSNFLGHATEVLANTLSGSDTNYHTAAGAVGVRDHSCPQ